MLSARADLQRSSGVVGGRATISSTSVRVTSPRYTGRPAVVMGWMTGGQNETEAVIREKSVGEKF